MDQGRLTSVDLIHEFPYRNSGIEATRDLESLDREIPVHETLKRSGPLDPNHRGSLDLVQELVYHNSGIEVTIDLESLHHELLVTENPKPQNPETIYSVDRRRGT